MMQPEEDEVFMFEGKTPPGESMLNHSIHRTASSEYTQIYGHDDVIISQEYHDDDTQETEISINQNFEQPNAENNISGGNLEDSFDVQISNPRIKLYSLRKKASRSESSDDGIYDNFNANQPLMYPRSRFAKNPTLPSHRRPCCCRSCAYFIFITIFLMVFALTVVYLVHRFGDIVLDIPGDSYGDSNETVMGCSSLSVESVWEVGIPKLMTESAFRLVDVNSDAVLDIIFGFATGAEGYSVPPLVCDIYFNGSHPCLGGLLALDGSTGMELWRHYTPHEIFAVNCQEDLDRDGVLDCIISGRVGGFEAVSGKYGHMLWNFSHPARVEAMNVYTGQFVGDLNADGVPDILNIHGGDPFGEPGSSTRLVGRILLISGRDGSVLQWLSVPDGRESYYSPVVYSRQDGTQMVVFGTGGETHPGSLWYISLGDLYKGDIHKAGDIVHNPYKGFMTPPVLIDLTRDGIEDLVFASYNSTVLAYDGETYSQLWNFTYPMSETYATPAPGYYNEDDVPDFIVHWQYGPGFPVYYHSITTILDGRDGTPLLTPYIQSSVGAQASPLVVSVEGFGNDIFLFWHADCKGHEGQSGDFTFIKGTNVHEQSRSDVCRLRFKTEGFSRLYAMNSHQMAPGTTIYDSEDHEELEHSAWVNTTVEALTYLRNHPENLDNYALWNNWVEQNIVEKEGPFGDSIIDDTDENEKHSRPSDIGSDTDEARHHLQEALAFITGQSKGPNDSPYHQGMVSGIDMNDSKSPGRSKMAQSSSNEDTGLEDVDPEFYQYIKDIYGSLDNEDTQKRHTRDTLNDNEGRMQNLPGSKRVVDAVGKTKRKHYDDNNKPRRKRHVGPHDEGGLQRLISTGSLAPPLLPQNHPDYNHSMDVVFATYWFYPAKTEILLPEDQACIDQRMEGQTERFDPNSKYYGMDDDAYEHVITKECLSVSNHQMPEGGTYNNQHTYNPYNVHMGQLTVYRMRLKCKCPIWKSGAKCSKILPFTQQQWAAYMGTYGTSHWRPARNSRHTTEN